MFDLTGRVALVTGAGQSIGAGIAETLAECGATVVVNDLYPDRTEAQAKEIERVVTISSGAGVQGLKIGVSTYAAGKGGAIAFMRHLALETAEFGVTANTLALGLMQNAAAAGASGLPPKAPVGRAGTGRDVGAAVVWLAAEGEWVTGQTIGINGGSSTT
jgi:NAD(P)-dependent dehydrogenase (short-subunit alcohol dehydrogenase family)